MTKIKEQKTKSSLLWLFFIALIIFVYFFGLGILPLVGPDEPRYSQVAREMFERNDFVTPTLGGFNWFEKPALLYWLQIIAYNIFGVSEFSARFGSALFGLLTILTIYLLCRLVENKELRAYANDFGFAKWSAIVSASTIGLLTFSRAASFDIILTFPIAAALACYFAFESFNSKLKSKNLTFLIGFYIFIGLALLAKGLVGIVLPFGIVFFYFLLKRKLPNKTFLFSLLPGILLSFAVSCAWYLPMYLRHGWEFIDEFFVQHHFARYTSNKYAHPEAFYFFWLILPVMTLPWLPFLFAAIWKIVSRKGAKAQSEALNHSVQNDLRLFALAWMFVPLIFFTFSGSKLPGYILPALPAAMILIANQVWQFAQTSRGHSLWLKILAVIVFLAVTIGIGFWGEKTARHDSAKYLMQKAAQQGYKNERVLNLHDLSHSLEFYAAGRLVRESDGKQHKFEWVGEIVNFMQQNNERKILVLVPLEHLHQLTESNAVQAQKIDDNGAFALVLVEIR